MIKNFNFSSKFPHYFPTFLIRPIVKHSIDLIWFWFGLKYFISISAYPTTIAVLNWKFSFFIRRNLCVAKLNLIAVRFCTLLLSRHHNVLLWPGLALMQLKGLKVFFIWLISEGTLYNRHFYHPRELIICLPDALELEMEL